MFDQFKPGKFFRYRYSPDDIVIRIKKVTEKTPSYVIVLASWLNIDFEQEIKITTEDVDSWVETK
jgi:hypothetical protein